MSVLATSLLLKSCIVLLAGWLAASVLRLRGAAAATRHLVWTLAVCALLLLPLLSAWMPAWESRWLGSQLLAMPRPATAAPFGGEPGGEPGGGAAADAEDAAVLPPPDAAAPRATAGTRAPSLQGARLWAVAYGIGAALAAGWLLAGFAGLGRLAARARAVADPDWMELMREVEWLLEVRRPVRLLRSAEATMPMAFGILRPAVILPAGADAWTEERRRVVLLHEVAHVARRDCLTQAFAALACALYWFHPGAWYAARQLRGERELACDDRVIAAGARPAVYAGHLLEIARSLRAPRLAGAVAVSMARPSQLEGRLLAVLDEARRRRPLAWPLTLGAGTAALALLLPLAALAPAAAATPESTIDGPAPSAAGTGGEVEQLVQTRFGDTLWLELGTASRVLISGWDRDAVQVRGWGTEESPVSVVLERSAHGARLVTRRAQGTRPAGGAHSLEIRVPRRYDLRIQGGGGSLEVADWSGFLRGSTQGGPVRLVQAGGRVELVTGGGSVSVMDARLDGRLLTSGGPADIRSNVGDLEIRAGAGGAWIEPPGAPAEARRFRHSVRAVTGVGRAAFILPEGSVFVDQADDGLNVETGRGDIVAGSVVGRAVARTAAGNVELRGVSGWAEAETGRGDVHVQMTQVRGATLTSRAGGVTVVLPAGFTGSIDALSTGRAGGIDSDFPLDPSPSPAGGERRLRAGTTGERVILRATGPIRIRRASGSR